MGRRRRVSVSGEGATHWVCALAEVQGFVVIPFDGRPSDLVVLGADDPAELSALPPDVPFIVFSLRRLRGSEAQRFRKCGARCIIDADSSVLDFVVAISDGLFATRRMQRDYSRRFGAVPVRVFPSDAGEGSALRGNNDGFGRMLHVRRSGAFVATETLARAGECVDLHVELAGARDVVRGRVVYVPRSQVDAGLAIEFLFEKRDLPLGLAAETPGTRIFASRTCFDPGVS